MTEEGYPTNDETPLRDLIYRAASAELEGINVSRARIGGEALSQEQLEQGITEAIEKQILRMKTMAFYGKKEHGRG